MIFKQSERRAIAVRIALDKGTSNFHIIDVDILNDTNMANNVIEKTANYFDLKVEMAKSYGLVEGNVKLISVLIGALR